MSPRRAPPEPAPSQHLRALLALEARQTRQLEQTRSALALALRQLSTDRGLKVPLRADAVRAELMMEEA